MDWPLPIRLKRVAAKHWIVGKKPVLHEDDAIQIAGRATIIVLNPSFSKSARSDRSFVDGPF
jgi:hypothetical protein